MTTFAGLIRVTHQRATNRSTFRRRVAMRTHLVGFGLVLAAMAASGPYAPAADGGEKHLFIWAGDQARQAPDFLAVVDFDERSADYGKVIATVPLPEPGATGNEPHHVGLSRNGKILACGGLLSVLKGQKEIFFFDVSDPTAPRLTS